MFPTPLYIVLPFQESLVHLFGRGRQRQALYLTTLEEAGRVERKMCDVALVGPDVGIHHFVPDPIPVLLLHHRAEGFGPLVPPGLHLHQDRAPPISISKSIFKVLFFFA